MPLSHTKDATLAGAGHGSTRKLEPVDADRYEVEAEVGEGGIGRVMRALDKRLNRRVAIKLLRRLSAEHEQRFFAEAEITARLEHPAIVPVHDVGRWHTGEPFYAMKLVTGDSLKDVVGALPVLTERLKLLPHVLTACDAVAYAHSRGVIHRDLKPSNVMVGAFGETLVIDWGLAKSEGSSEVPAVVGTPHYMAPEQARGEEADARSDVYALGAMLYEVLAGRAPYDDDTEGDVLERVSASPPGPLPPQAPAELQAIVAKAMQRERRERYGDAKELGADLRRYQEGQWVGAYRYSALERVSRLVARNKPLTVVALVSLAVLAAGGAYSLDRIVSERDAARAAEKVAAGALGSAESRRNQLMLAQAKLWLEKDPTIAFAWLKSFAGTKTATPQAVSAVAADALSRGVAQQLVRGRKRVAVSPDGATLAGVEGKQIVVWRADRSEAKAIAEVEAKVAMLRFSADGSALFAADGPKLKLLDLRGGAAQVLLDSGNDPLSSIMERGEWMTVGSEGGTVWVRRAGLFEKLRKRGAAIGTMLIDDARRELLVSDGDDGFEVIRLEDGKTVLAGQGDGPQLWRGLVSWGDGSGTVFLHDLSAKKTKSWSREHDGAVSGTVLTPDGRLLVSMGQDHVVVVRDLQKDTRRLLSGSEGWVLRGSTTRDSELLLTVGQDHIARVWHLPTGTSWAMKGHTAPFRLCAFTADERHIVTADAEGEVRVWATPRPRSKAFVGAHESQYEEARFLPDGRVVSAGEDGALNVWHPESNGVMRMKETGSGGSLTLAGSRLSNGGSGGVWVREITALERPVTSITWVGELHQATLSRDGARLATAGADHAIRVFELPSGQGKVVGTHPAAAWHVAFSPDGKWLASTGDDLPVRVWSLTGGQPRALDGAEGIVYDLQFSPDGRWLAAVGLDTTVRLWSVPAFEPRALKGHSGIVRQLAFSPDASRLATASDDRTARLWPMEGGEPLVLPHAGQLAAVAFSADGAVLASADDLAIRRWDAKTGVLLAVEREHTAAVSGLAVSPDGTALVSAAEDHTVRYWPGFFKVPAAPSDVAALNGASSVELKDDVAVSR